MSVEHGDEASLGSRILLQMALCAFQTQSHDRARGFCRQALKLNPSVKEKSTANKLIARIQKDGRASIAMKRASGVGQVGSPRKLNRSSMFGGGGGGGGGGGLGGGGGGGGGMKKPSMRGALLLFGIFLMYFISEHFTYFITNIMS